jgi:hypothetical protein
MRFTSRRYDCTSGGVTLLVDPSNRVPETNESNNDFRFPC